MSNTIQEFLKSSPISRKVGLQTRVILHRTRLNLQDISAIKQKGSWSPNRFSVNECDLEVGGVIIAQGEIVESEGESFFKVTQLSESAAEER